MSARDHSDAWVCTDCYVAHAYGATFHERAATRDEIWKYQQGYETYPTMRATDAGLVIGEWFAGDSDTPADREPLARLDGLELSDNTCSNHDVSDTYDSDGDSTGDTTACEYCRQTGYENGQEEFSWRTCQGCGSSLGGSRYRLAVWEVAP